MSNNDPKAPENKKESVELNENELNEVSGGMGIRHGSSKPGNKAAPTGGKIGHAVSEDPNRHGSPVSGDNVMSDEAKADKSKTSSHR